MSVIQDFDLYGTSCDISSSALSELKLNIANSNLAGDYCGIPIDVSLLHPKAYDADFTPRLFKAKEPHVYSGIKEELIPFLKKIRKTCCTLRLQALY